MTRAEALGLGTARLRAAGIGQPRREARLLLAHALGMDQEGLLADLEADVEASVPSSPSLPSARGGGESERSGQAPLPLQDWIEEGAIGNGSWENDPVSAYLSLVARRAAREPLAFIVGSREFWSLLFEVSPDTLVPRPESETLIEAALAAFPNRSAPLRVLDLGTGTGCLLLAALSEFTQAFGVGVDRVDAALALARRNAVRLGLAGRAGFVCGDWSEPLAGRFDLILCNPPYIPSAEIPRLMPEVAAHEPLSALDGGPDGLKAYRKLLPLLPGLLAPGGAAVVELGIGQAEPVAALAAPSSLPISLAADLSGIARALVLGRVSLKKSLAAAAGRV